MQLYQVVLLSSVQSSYGLPGAHFAPVIMVHISTYRLQKQNLKSVHRSTLIIFFQPKLFIFDSTTVGYFKTKLLKDLHKRVKYIICFKKQKHLKISFWSFNILGIFDKNVECFPISTIWFLIFYLSDLFSIEIAVWIQ